MTCDLGHILGVQPPILRIGRKGQLVVLQVVFADQNHRTVRRAKAHGPGGLQRLDLPAIVVFPNIAVLFQFLPDFKQLRFFPTLSQVVHLPLEIVEFFLGLLHLFLCQNFRRARLLIELKIALRILVGRELFLQRNFDHRCSFLIIVGKQGALLPLFDKAFQARGEQFPLQAVFLHALAAQQRSRCRANFFSHRSMLFFKTRWIAEDFCWMRSCRSRAS